MTLCDRCYRPLDQGDHGLNLCPLEPRRANVVRPDSIPGGLTIEHGLCDPVTGEPRTYYSQSEIDRECKERGLMRWTDLHEESRTRDARERIDWGKSGEAARLRKQNTERERDERRAR